MRPTMPVSPTRALTSLAAAAALVALTACSSATADEPASEEEPVDAAGNGVEGVEIATVVGDGIDVHAEPGGEEVLHTLASPNDFGVERAFLVERNEGEWLQVLLPVRPNGSTGWVRSDEVWLTSTEYRVEVDTGDFAFTVFDGDEEVRTGVIGTGEGETPTPEGRYYFTELLQPPDPEGPYGVYAFGLSGFSETLETFAGGPGQLAVHGTNDEDALGREISHGCVRVSNEDITWMAENLPIGTPVEISG
ncbi:Putative L,D-transpeptidase YkuD [Nocardiopsis dassonvillei]|uniref:ErfK/YbiS/YcfS/YnhG family protein n=2 Tax=Nocardiopsis dassonvillei TaxID=2014 RepID=D7AZ75_NOCDD|nr:ErfK/YbiS/YcfS/YnhG family protein [Nocardiopsis dassonvillei subsp. dassonvillei DSM 43111]VEI90570.1 Putative L,D-transpeptidase YkuD [Nocardiopsis dassonvillei]